MDQPLTGRALVILGAPRSGTSAVANVFRLLGCFLGEDSDFPPPKEGNPAGIFERGEILAFNSRCLETLYMGHDRPDGVPLSEHPAFPRFVDEASMLLRAMFAGREFWGWKEPTSTLLAPIYRAALAREGVQESFLLCVRRPSEVIASQQRIMDVAEGNREAPIGPRAYRRWMSYALKSLQYSAGVPRAMIAYHSLVSDPKRVIQDAFHVVAPEQESLPLEAAINAVTADYYRNRREDEVPADAPPPIHRMWDLCGRISEDPERLTAGAFDSEISAVEAEFDLLANCFAEPASPYGQIVFSLPGNRVAASAPILPSDGWTKVDLEIPAGAAIDLVGNLYPLPGNVFIRNASWGAETARIRAVNDTAEAVEGSSTRFELGFSSPQVSVKTPASVGPYRLTMEVFVELNIFTGFDALLRQTRKTRALEEEIRRLRQRAGFK